MIKLSLIIVNYHADTYVQALLKSIPKEKSYETIVINNSHDNRGFAAACNEAAAKAKGKYLLFINPDTVIKPGALELMLGRIEKDPRIGILGPQLLNDQQEPYLSTTKQPIFSAAFVVYSFLDTYFPHNRFSIDYWYKKYSLHKERWVESISGAVMLIPKTIFNEIDGFDEQYFLYWEDYDICRKILLAGKKILFFPKAKIIHYGGKTTPQHNAKIRGIFRTSRFRYFVTLYGWLKATLVETWLTATEEWRLILILVLAAFLRFDRITSLMPLIGDQGRDFLAAETALKEQQLPLLGIPSSVPRFRQGPLYIWFTAATFALTESDPAAAGIMAATFGLLAVACLYILVDRYMGRYQAIIASLILATAPLAVTQSRMAFLPNAIPLFSVIFLWRLWKKPAKKIDWFWLGLVFSLLFQFELAVAPIGFLLGVVIWEQRKLWLKKILLAYLLAGIMVGSLPQIIFDVSHRFQQIGLFMIWIGYRIISFFGFDKEHTVSINKIGVVFARLHEYGQRFVAPGLPLIWWFFVLGIGIWMLYRKHSGELQKIWWWVIILLISFLVHSGPSEAYFPVLFVPISIIIADMISVKNVWYQRLLLILVGLGIVGNVIYLRDSDYGVATPQMLNRGYVPVYGQPLYFQQEISRIIRKEAGSKPIYLAAYGEGSEFESAVDNYRFLLSHETLVANPDEAYLRVWFLRRGSETTVIPNAHVYTINQERFALQK